MAGDPARPAGMEALATFATNVAYDDLPAEAVHAAKRCLVDQFGCALFGATPPWSRLLQTYVEAQGSAPVARVWGTNIRTSPALAGLANGLAGHAFEIDDLHTDGTIHPGAVAIPAALAIAEKIGGVSGREFLAAVVAGYEVGIRVGMVMGIPHFLRGFHPQGTVGVFCAVVAAGRLLKLDVARMSDAIAIAASQGAGLMGAQEGGMVKRFHSGHACHAGVMAAELAAIGFTGARDALEAPFGGFIQSLRGETVNLPALTAGLGTVWETSRVGFKAYASCATVHTSIDAIRKIMSEHRLAADDILEIVAHVTTDAWIHSGFEYRGEDVTSAQMNIHFGVAAFICDGEVGPRQFAAERLRDPRILALIERIKVEPDTALDAKGRAKRFSAWMEVRRRHGDPIIVHIETRRGEGELLLSDAEVFEKYDALAAAVPGVDGRALRDAVMAIETMPDMAALAALLCPSQGADR